MNLHRVAGAVVNTINPRILATIQRGSGYTTGPDGTQTPLYTNYRVMIQKQELTADELRQTEGLNLQGHKASVYLSGRWEGLIRADGSGGDVLWFCEQAWLVVSVLESWPQWTKLLIVMQNGS